MGEGVDGGSKVAAHNALGEVQHMVGDRKGMAGDIKEVELAFICRLYMPPLIPRLITTVAAS